MMKWKDRWKKGLSVFLTMAVIGSCVNATAIPAFAEEGVGEKQEDITFMVPGSEDELPDSEELFAGYVEKVFYESLNDGISTYGNVGEERLEGVYNQKVYAVLKEKIKEVAAGKTINTNFLLNFEELGLENLQWTAAELGVSSITSDNVNDVNNTINKKLATIIDSRSILEYLLMDCPYELYWFDKGNNGGMGVGTRASFNTESAQISGMEFLFIVADEYKAGDYTVTSDIAVVHTAVENAKKIVEKYAGKSDYEKMTGYRQEICSLVSYNHEAAGNANTPYGNPWQLIWVFDNDTKTNVVCEGYAKAFQYLCDMSEFIDATCYTVVGEMSGGTGAGPHMWNIVTLDGKNYLVDVTNCDEGSIGADDKLFLAGVDGDVTNGYQISLDNITIQYTYDKEQEALFGNTILTLSNSKYTPKQSLTVKATQKGDIIYGDAVAAAHIDGSASTADGTNVSGTFSWAPSVTSYGNVGTKTLKAIFTPSNTELYNRTEVSISVTVAPADYKVVVTDSQKVISGMGEFIQPTFIGVQNENVEGTLTYTYNQQTMSYEQLKDILSNLVAAHSPVTVSYSFTTTNSNYKNIAKTGTLTFTIESSEIIAPEGPNNKPDDGNNSSGSTGEDNNNQNGGETGNKPGNNGGSGSTGEDNNNQNGGETGNRPGNNGDSGTTDSGILEGTGSSTDTAIYGTRLLAANPTTFNTIMLNWDAVPGAKSYEIFYSTSPDSGFRRLANVKKTFYKFSKAKCGVTYYFQMRVCQKDAKSEFGPISYGKTALTGSTALQVKKTTYNSVTLRWNKVAGAKKYEIFCMDSIGREWKSLGIKGGTSFTHKKLVTGATYYYQIRPVRDSFYGNWSNSVSSTTILENISNLKAKATGIDRMKVTWRKVKGATQYVILRAETIDGVYEVIGHSNKTSYVDFGLKSGTTYFYKVYAVSGPYRTQETEPVGQMTKLPKK